MNPYARSKDCQYPPLVLMLSLLLVPSPAKADEPVAESHFLVSAGAEYIADTSVPGQELTQKTIPLVMTRESDDYTVEFTIPYLQRTAPSGKIAKDHHHESTHGSAPVTPRITSQGLGDITTSLQRTLLSEKDAAFSLFVKGEIKFGTADVKQGLGTGMNDYFLEIKTKKTFDAFTAGASIGHAKFGNPGTVTVDDITESINFRDIYYGALGGTYQVNENLKTGLNLEMGQAAQAGGYQQRDFSGTAEYKFSTNKTVRLMLLKSITPGISSWTCSAYLSTEL